MVGHTRVVSLAADQGRAARRRRRRLRPPPGRVFIVGPAHTFEQLAHAINAAFARCDLSHLHQFELADGRLIGYPDDSYEPDVVWHVLCV